ncbi:UNVERIFIED_CONTAM: Copia protein [Sesamum angustifolium]|uniref:Copia protein n=1 Tax=Sesamum angustifolium TaxID=2727405 RepID=A0AAW2ILL7_9LAMI
MNHNNNLSQDRNNHTGGFCTNCGESGHTKSRCYELIGYPEWWDPSKAPLKRNSKSHCHVVGVVEPSNKAQKESSPQTSIVVTKPSDTGKVFQTSTSTINNSWIIDSGATDHMTFDTNHVKSLKISKERIEKTANGNSAPVVGEAHMPNSYWGEAFTAAAYLINRISSSTLQFQTSFDVFHKATGENKNELETLNNSFDTLQFINISGGRNLDVDVGIRNKADQSFEHESSQGHVENADVQNFQEHTEVASREDPHPHNVPLNQLLSQDVLTSESQQSAGGFERSKMARSNEQRNDIPLKRTQHGDIVDLPDGKKHVGCNWVFTIKYKFDGTIERYKARLVAKGYTQTYEVDYT